MKTCTCCNKDLETANFHKDKSRKDGFRDRCKSCVSEYMALHYQQNSERIKTNVYGWIENNRARHNAKCAKWAKQNPEKVNARTARRYAAKTNATPAWLDADQLWMITEAYDLARLRTELLGINFEVDHIVPLRGKKVMGLHVPWNLRVTPSSTNRRKSNTFEVT